MSKQKTLKSVSMDVVKVNRRVDQLESDIRMLCFNQQNLKNDINSLREEVRRYTAAILGLWEEKDGDKVTRQLPS